VRNATEAPDAIHRARQNDTVAHGGNFIVWSVDRPKVYVIPLYIMLHVTG